MSAVRHTLNAALEYAEKLEQENERLSLRLRQLEKMAHDAKPKEKPVEQEKDASWMADVVKHAQDRGVCQDIEHRQRSTFDPNIAATFQAVAKEVVPVESNRLSATISPFLVWIDGNVRTVELLANHGGMLKVATVDDPSKESVRLIDPKDIHPNDAERVKAFMVRFQK